MKWPMGTVADIAEVISGYAFKSEWFGEGKDKVIRIGDLKNGRVDVENAAIFSSQINPIKNQFRIKSGDILMALSGATVGKIAIADSSVERCYLNQRVAIIRGKSQENSDFLKYVFSGTPLQTLLLNAGGAAQPNLSPKDLSNMQIPLPPLEEQKRIAAILDKADAIRRKRQQAIKLADDFLRTVFLDMFGDPVTNPKGWEKVSMEDFGTFKNGLNFGRGEAGNSLHCLGVGNFKSLDRIEDVFALPKVELNKLPAEDYLLKNDDLVFVRSNGNKALVGRCITIHPGKEKVTFSGFCIRYRIENIKLDANFLNLCLRIPSMKNEMLQGGQGVNIQNINQKLLASLKVPLPPIEQQKSFSDLVSTFRLLLAKKQDSLKSSSELFNYLSQKAFAGEL